MIPFNGVNGLRITTHLRIQISYILFVFGVNSGKNQIPYIIEHTQILCFCLFLLLFNCNGIFYFFTFVSSAHNIHLSFTCRVSLFIDSEATFIPPFLTINSFFFPFHIHWCNYIYTQAIVYVRRDHRCSNKLEIAPFFISQRNQRKYKMATIARRQKNHTTHTHHHTVDVCKNQ